MTTPHEAIAAWPVTGNADKALARALATRRLPYALSGSESAADLVAVDPATGVVPLYLIQDGTLFEYDSLDSTTSASAVCLVTSDAKRYKSGGITPPYSVLTVGITAQPATPAIGDTYLVPTAATGTDWAGQDGKIAIYSRAGWQFAISPIGRGLYAEDTDIRWYRNDAGTWVSGFGAVSVGAGGVNITNMLGAKASFVVKVENQTTTTAPASPVAFVAYIVAGSGGAWSGYSVGDVAMCLTDGTWTRIVPSDGDEVYDNNLRRNYRWSSTALAWQVDIGQHHDYVSTNSAGTTDISGSPYTYSSGTPPTTSHLQTRDDSSKAFTARPGGEKLLIKYRCLVQIAVAAGGLGSGNTVLAFFRDSVTNAIAHFLLPEADYVTSTNYDRLINMEFIYTAPDNLAHTYFASITKRSGTGGTTISGSTWRNRLLQIEEKS